MAAGAGACACACACVNGRTCVRVCVCVRVWLCLEYTPCTCAHSLVLVWHVHKCMGATGMYVCVRVVRVVSCVRARVCVCVCVTLNNHVVGSARVARGVCVRARGRTCVCVCVCDLE